MNEKRHVIKRQVLEIPLAKPDEVVASERLFKQLYYQHLLPTIEGYFNRVAEPHLHYQFDKIELEIKDFNWDKIAITEVIAQLNQQLAIQLAKQSSLAENVQPKPVAKTALQILQHFLQTGTLPWWAQRLNRQEFDVWLQQLLQHDRTALSLLRTLLRKPCSRKRCILQFSDDSLWLICQQLLPQFQLSQVDWTLKTKDYPSIATLLGIEPVNFRLQHWETLLEISMISKQQVTPMAFMQKYWYRLAKISDGKLKDWLARLSKARLLTSKQRQALANIAGQTKSYADQDWDLWLAALTDLQKLSVDSSELVAKLTRVEKWLSDTKFTKLTMQQWQALKQQLGEFKQMLLTAKAKQNIATNATNLESEALALQYECQLYLLNFEQSLARLGQQLDVLQQLMAQLQQIYKLPPPSHGFGQALQQLNNSLIHEFKPFVDAAIVQRCLNLLKYAKTRLFNTNSDQELLNYTQKFYGLIDTEIEKLQLIINYARQNLTEVQQQLIPYQRFQQALQVLLEQLQEPQISLNNEIIEQFKQAMLNLSTTDLRLWGQKLLGKVAQVQCQPNPANNMALKISGALHNLLKNAAAISGQAKKLPIADDFSEVDEFFIGNAGLVILWPYLGRFYERLGLIADGRFIDQAAAERAAIVSHYLITPAEQPSEPWLVLNKLLCGLDLAEPIALEIGLTEQERLAAEDLLSAVAGHWAALKTTNPALLRQLFLQRQGSVQIKDGSYLVRIERKSHDILLEKLPWSIANIKLPWLSTLIRVEW